MSNKIVLRQAASAHRRQPLLQVQSSKTGSSFGEVVGATTAECVAVCCCFPCGLANFLVLAIYKVPTGLCRRILRKRQRRRIIKEGLLPPKRRNCSCGCCEDVNGPRIHPMCANDDSDIKRVYSSESVVKDKDAIALEKEMWERFDSAGFWRSSSRRESQSQSTQILPANIQLQLIQIQPQQSSQVAV
ncbi:uncharacterized protein [Cicer arietinum]|uniref:Uncharacterized protein LOC101488959 n=1 Tax=Cicer arietinum TaxID=3827 RepID=A0A1S2XWA3_CICAR|nr:uncharacterized protein LOC101488959 [Cicer arietinum]